MSPSAASTSAPAQKTAAPSAPGETFAKIRGNGRFDTEVVGESYYTAAFERLCGAKAGTEEEFFGDAVLTLEDNNPHDNQAVAVSIDGHKVGHLSRDLAREFRQALGRDGVAGRTQYAVAARVYAGGLERMFSVSLDLPHDD
jgi:hypothetical protein